MVEMKIISKTVVKQEGSDRWPRYRIVREYFWVDEENTNDEDLSPIDLLFWTGNGWSDKKSKALLYTDFGEAVTDKDEIGDLI